MIVYRYLTTFQYVDVKLVGWRRLLASVRSENIRKEPGDLDFGGTNIDDDPSAV